MSVATRELPFPTFPFGRGAAIALTAAAPVAIGAVMAARAEMLAPMAAAPSIVFGVGGTAGSPAEADIALLETRANAADCDLTVPPDQTDCYAQNAGATPHGSVDLTRALTVSSDV